MESFAAAPPPEAIGNNPPTVFPSSEPCKGGKTGLQKKNSPKCPKWLFERILLQLAEVILIKITLVWNGFQECESSGKFLILGFICFTCPKSNPTSVCSLRERLHKESGQQCQIHNRPYRGRRGRRRRPRAPGTPGRRRRVWRPTGRPGHPALAGRDGGRGDGLWLGDSAGNTPTMESTPKKALCVIWPKILIYGNYSFLIQS